MADLSFGAHNDKLSCAAVPDGLIRHAQGAIQIRRPHRRQLQRHVRQTSDFDSWIDSFVLSQQIMR
jgi:hypothetical protein